MLEKITSQPCLRNQQPIFEAIKPWVTQGGQLLELASGTGQHGVYISARLPQLHWQLSEHPDNMSLSQPWVDEADLPNLKPCIAVDVAQDPWPVHSGHFDYAYCANLLHFVSLDDVDNIFRQVTHTLKKNGLLFCYGPVNEDGFTSEGNQNLDAWLKQDVNPKAGIKELKVLKTLAHHSGLAFKSRLDCPANNVILIFENKKS